MKFKFNKFLVAVFLLGFRVLVAMDSGDASSWASWCYVFVAKEGCAKKDFVEVYNVCKSTQLINLLKDVTNDICRMNRYNWMQPTRLYNLFESVDKLDQSPSEYIYRIELYQSDDDGNSHLCPICTMRYDYLIKKWTIVDAKNNAISLDTAIRALAPYNVRLVINIIRQIK